MVKQISTQERNSSHSCPHSGTCIRHREASGAEATILDEYVLALVEIVDFRMVLRESRIDIRRWVSVMQSVGQV